jgi:hypothetical protein
VILCLWKLLKWRLRVKGDLEVGFLGKRTGKRLGCLAKLKWGSNLGESDIGGSAPRGLSAGFLAHLRSPLRKTCLFFDRCFNVIWLCVLVVAFGFWLLLVEVFGVNPQGREEDQC